MSCVTPGCVQAVGRNGLGCHQHFTALVPGFLARAFFAERHPFTRNWLGRQIRHALRGEDWSA